MAVTQYIGSRYVPLFADPIEWSSSNTYEPLTIVVHEGNSYTSKQAVPKGIDIANEAFWAETGNYDAQVEQYRRETAQVRSEIASVGEKADSATETATTAKDAADAAQASANAAQASANAAQASADAAQTDVDTLKSFLPSDKFSTSNTVMDAIDGVAAQLINAQSDTDRVVFLGSMHPRDYGQTNPQGMCILPNNTGLFVYTNSSDSNATVCVIVNLSTGEIVNTINTNWGHANGVCYNVSNNSVYVCPVNDYEGSAVTFVDQIFRCDPNTLSIIETISTPFHAHSVCYDKITKQMYVTAQEGSNIALYEFDYTSVDFKRIGVIDFYRHFTSLYNTTIYTQTINAYNGTLYYGISTTHMQKILVFNTLDKLLGCLNLPVDAYSIYSLRELESFDFTDNGDIVFFGSGCVFGLTEQYSVIGGINLSGMLGGFQMRKGRVGLQYSAHVKPSRTTNIRRFGDSGTEFPTVYEAIASVMAGFHSSVTLDEDANFFTNFQGNCAFSFLKFYGGGHRLQLDSNVYMNGVKMSLENITLGASADGLRILMYQGEFYARNMTFDIAHPYSDANTLNVQVQRGTVNIDNPTIENQGSLVGSMVNYQWTAYRAPAITIN